MPCVLPLVVVAILGQAQEPAPRALRAVPLRVSTPPSYVSAVFELADGRVLLTNARQPSVILLDPRTGHMTPVGAAGGGPDRYARPGGLYAGRGGSVQMLDRGQTRAFTVAPDGKLTGSRSIARRGHTSSSDDTDLQRLDANGLVYLVDRSGTTTSSLLRLDPVSQALEKIAELRLPESRVIPGGDGVTITRSFIGSPADGWGVAPDGRVALVRADPYRVEWLAREGTMTRGPIIQYTPLPMTDTDKQDFAARRRARGGGVGIGRPGDPAPAQPLENMLFAETKAPFDAGDVTVSPDGRVWVLRAQPFGAKTALYDVFDGAGRRVDRVQVPAEGRIIGFGRGAVYVRMENSQGIELRKYSLVRP